MSIKIISQFYYSNLRTERQIQTIDKMITKHLIRKGKMWLSSAPVAAFAMNTFVSPSF